MLVEWEDRATRDVRNIYEYLAERNGRAAIRIRNAIFAHAAILATHPEVGRRGGWPGSRELAVSRTQYILVYEIEPDTDVVRILRVFHGAQYRPEEL